MVTRNGTRLAETMFGTTGADSIFGAGGNDVIYGGRVADPLFRDGGDILDGGAGNDRIYGGLGDDRLLHSPGADSFYGGGGHDTLDYTKAVAGLTMTLGAAAAGNGGAARGDIAQSIETLIGSRFADVLTAEARKAVTLFGGAGNDLLTGGARNDLLYGGAGRDRFVASGGNDSYFGGAGMDTLDYSRADAGLTFTLGGPAEGNSGDYAHSIERLIGSRFSDVLTAGGDAASLYGGKGNDILSGGAGADQLYGGAGRDRFIGSGGADIHYGGAGRDELDYRAAAAGVTLSLDGNQRPDINYPDKPDRDAAFGVETIIGSAFGDQIYFSQDALRAGRDQAVTVYGGGGDDIFYGGTKASVFYGGAGDDEFDGLSARGGGDIAYGGGGNDGLNGFQGNDTLYGGAGDDWLHGGSGADRLFGGAGKDFLALTGNTTATGGAGADEFAIYDPYGAGTERITDFSIAAGDRLIFMNIDLDSYADLLAVTTEVDGDTHIQFERDGVVILEGLRIADLTADAFGF